MKTLKTKAASQAFVAAFLLGGASLAAAQGLMPAGYWACQAPSGVYPMPHAIPQVGLPCGNGFEQGFTVFVPAPPAPMGGGYIRSDSAPSAPKLPPVGPRGKAAGLLGANREAQLAAECSGAGDPWSVGACITARLTTDELQKCRNGIGAPNGCFGPGNTLRFHVENALSDLTTGPGDSNDLTGRNGFTCKRLGICL